jgi:hypothetical protein
LLFYFRREGKISKSNSKLGNSLIFFIYAFLEINQSNNAQICNYISEIAMNLFLTLSIKEFFLENSLLLLEFIIFYFKKLVFDYKKLNLELTLLPQNLNYYAPLYEFQFSRHFSQPASQFKTKTGTD